MLKMEIHVEISVPSNEVGVNQVIALFEQIEKQLGPALARCYLERAQDRILESGIVTARNPDSVLLGQPESLTVQIVAHVKSLTLQGIQRRSDSR